MYLFLRCKQLCVIVIMLTWLGVITGLQDSKKGELLSKYGQREKNFENKIGKSAAFKENKVRSLLQCAGRCQTDGSCVSFFYNKETRECQGQNTVFESHTPVDESPDIRTTAKLIEKLSRQQFQAKETIRNAEDANFCLTKCHESPSCMAVSYNKVKDECSLFDKVHFITQRQKYDGIAYYRMSRSFCDEDEDYVLDLKAKVCYKFSDKKMTWDRADKTCKAEGAHLIDIPTAEVKKMVETFSKELDVYDEISIGINSKEDQRYDVNWKGERINTNLWKGNFLGSLRYKCLYFVKRSYGVHWVKSPCDTKFSYYICSK